MQKAGLDWFHAVFSRRAAPVRPESSGPAAIAALLVRAARANNDYDTLQIAEIDRVTAKRFGLGAWEQVALRREAEALDDTIGDTVHLTRRIKEVVALEDRPGLLRDLWAVILADGKRHDEEDGLMRLVSNLLGLSDRDSALARQAVQRQGS
jgi:uncharacterized tellurite resistance protein B-like protein